MNQSLTLAFLIAAGIGLVVQNTLMVRITQTSSTILIAMLLNSLVGIVLFVSILWFKQGMAGFGELVSSVRWWTLIPGLLGSFFVFASISGYQNVGAATTIAVLVASQLIGGLVLDIFRSHGVPLRALIGPICGAILLAMIKFTRFLVVYVREETQMRLRINRRRISNRFTAAALVTDKTRSIKHIGGFTAELV